MNIVDWRYTDNVDGSRLIGHLHTTFQHIVNVLGEPQRTDGDNTTAEWAVLATVSDEDGYDEDVLFTIYDWRTNSTPMGEYRWHIGGHSLYAIEVAAWFLGVEFSYNLQDISKRG